MVLNIVYLTGAWLVFNGPSVRKATVKFWFKSKAEAQQYVRDHEAAQVDRITKFATEY